MATQGQRYRSLCAFLDESFVSPMQLKQFLVFNDYEAVARAANAHAGQTDYSFHVVEELNRLGLIDEAFFDRLTREFPAKTPQIRALVQLWLGRDQAGSQPSGSLTSSDPPAAVITGAAPPRDPAPITPPRPAADGDRTATLATEPCADGGEAERPPVRVEPRGRHPVGHEGTLGDEPKTPEPKPAPWRKRLFYSGAGVGALLFLVLLAYAVSWGLNPDGTKVNLGSAPATSHDIVKGGPKAEKKSPPPKAELDFITALDGQIRLNRILGGTLQMGSPESEGEPDEHPRHPVEVPPFYLGVTEVTQAQYRAVMGENPSYFSDTGGGKDAVKFQSTDQHPVESVSWFNAVEFCNRLSAKEGLPRDQWCYEPNPAGAYAEGMTVPPNILERTGYRLPTEAEWEYACRAGHNTSKYCFGDDENELSKYAWFGESPNNGTHPVRGKRPNDWRLYDMHGNVWEWCGDWYDNDYYKQMLNINSTGPREGTDRVLRGGSFLNLPVILRSAYRVWNGPAYRCGYFGFRLARTYH